MQTSFLSQGTSEWLAWRKKGIGSSEIAAVMNASPYMTRLELYEQKIGLREEQKENWAMKRGTRLEPTARALYELMRGVEMPAILAKHPEYDYLRASLDGANTDIQKGIEIKCAGKETYTNALNHKKIPEHHWIQIQYQILVTGFKSFDYVVYYEGTMAIVEVFPDDTYIKKLFREAASFWSLVVTRTPPDLQEEDFAPIEDQKQIGRLIEWKLLQSQIDRLSEKSDQLREQIIKNLKHKRMIGAGIKIYPQTRRGSVSYKDIPELAGLDLEKYRGKTTESFIFKPMKEEGHDLG